MPVDRRGTQLRSAIAYLGPVFVKIAQTLATRSDIVSKELAKELGLLQDAMDTFDVSISRGIIQEEFRDLRRPIVVGEPGSGQPLYADLSTEPVAAASMAQVHRGSLSDGTLVAVKVQRPGLAEKVGLDFYILRVILAAVNAILGVTRGSAVIKSVLDEVGDGIFAELDFTMEARNIERFKELYGAACPNVKVPDVIWDLTRPRVLP